MMVLSGLNKKTTVETAIGAKSIMMNNIPPLR